MLSNKVIIKTCVLVAIVSWTALLLFDLIFIVGRDINVNFSFPEYINEIFLSLYSLAIFVYFKSKLEQGDNVNFLELLWSSFFTGLVTTILALLFKLDAFIPMNLMKNIYVVNILYHILISFVIIFLISSFIAWKRLILFQKSSILLNIWYLFEISLIASILLNFLPFNYLDYRFYGPFFFLLVLGIILSVNLKWVAYINFKQKWQSILLILLTLVYITFILSTLTNFSNSTYLEIDITSSVFILSLFAFVTIYAFFSILVIIFNLPTSSVFEQKMEEVINFQKLSQSLQIGQKEEHVYNILIDTSLTTVLADGGWLEIYAQGEKAENVVKRNINDSQIEGLKQSLSKEDSERVGHFYNRNINKKGIEKKLGKFPFHSMLIIPIVAKSGKMGQLVLLKTNKDGFTNEMVNIVNAFVNQAAVFIENSRLLSQAIKNERYKEELTIARKVQKSLLPSDINQSEYYTIASFTEAAEEVGGDYYDIYKFSENKTAFIIGDVSGKGTSAAFHMAQLKGVFHSLVQLDLSAQEFLNQANKALSRCLERTSFITITFFFVDLHHHKIQLIRAGHCPALFYDSINKKVYYLNTKGLGLGILRNQKFDNVNDVIDFVYNSNDILLLYTDGIVEAKNAEREEYGYERLKAILEKTHDFPAEKINQAIIEDLYNFCGTKKLEDDYTLVIIKFN
ncbi:MAG TPA: PP2C family protein-serine/threonine phosphatase [Cytophagales bacterium]|nr:PP2C family protein-serine/threonine phosphatase [Cytophagales bacterium]